MPTGALRPVAHDPELATVFWTFPNDRKIATLPALVNGSDGLARVSPPPGRQAELVAYAPEKAATVRVAADGRAVAFAKAYAGEEGERTHRIHGALAETGVPVARSLAYSHEHRTLFVEPIDGRAIADLDPGEHRIRDRSLRGGARRPAPPAGSPRRAPLRGGSSRSRSRSPPR